MRAGKYIRQPSGYRAFIPKPLPPSPPVQMDAKLTRLLSDADQALGRLDGVATVLPNPDLFVAMYVHHEAVLSSQIEGTQSTLEDVLAFEANRAQYYDRLMAVRNAGDWEGWLKFFLRGVYEVSLSATVTARDILALREKDRALVTRRIRAMGHAHKLLDLMYQAPVFSINRVKNHLNCVYRTAAGVVEQFRELGIVKEITGQRRNRLYRYDAYLSLFTRQVLRSRVLQDEDRLQQATEADGPNA